MRALQGGDPYTRQTQTVREDKYTDDRASAARASVPRRADAEPQRVQPDEAGRIATDRRPRPPRTSRYSGS